MKYSTQINTVIVAMLVILALCSPMTLAAPKDALLDMIPADALFCVRINQFNASLGKMDQYMAGASPLPVSLMLLANMQLAGIVGDPSLAGIDKDGAFMAIGFASDTGVEMVVLTPVTEYGEFIKNPACSPSDTPKVTQLAAASSPVGPLALMAAPGGKYALVTSIDEQASLPAMGARLAAAGSKLAATLDAEQSAQAAAAPVWLYVNLARVNELYSPMLLSMIDEMQMQMPQDAAMGGTMAGAMEMNFQMLTGMVKTFLGESDALTLALSPEPAVLNMDIAFRAKDGTAMAAMLIADPQAAQTFTLGGFADNTAAMNAMFKVNRPLLEKFNVTMIEMLTASLGSKMKPEDIEQINSLAGKSLKAMGKEAVFSFSYGPGQPPFMFRQAQYINDPATIKPLMQEGLAAANTLYKAMDLPFAISYQPGVETYKTVPIDAIKMSFNTEGNQEGDEASEAIKKLYGPDGLTYYAAQTDKMLFMTFGPDSKKDLTAMLDVPAGQAAAGDLQTALTVLGPAAQQADIVGSINYLKLVKGGLGMASQMAGPAENEMLTGLASAMDIQTKSCMAFSATIANGKVATRLALPKQHLSEIVTAAMQAQAQMMQQQTQSQGGMGGGMAQPEPAPASPFAPQAASRTQNAAQPKDPLQEWVGKPAPDLKVTDLQGNKISIAELKGKKVILDFWATWCPPCKEMVPYLVELRNGAAPTQLAILGISNEPIDRLNKFIKDFKVNYPVISHTGAMPDPYAKVTGLPTTFYIDSSGIIRHVFVGYHEMEDIKTALSSMQ
jgi:peroxiredoxin